MAWIYLAESAGLPSRSSDGLSPSLIAKTTPTLRRCSLQEWRTAYCLEHPSGTTFGPSAQASSQPASISSTAASPARTFLLPDLERAWTALAQGLSLKSGDWLMSYDPVSSFWKTCQASLLADWTPSLPRLPDAGLMLGGFVFPLTRWAPAITETDGGSLLELLTLMGRELLPTPLARDWKDGSRSACAGIPVNGYLGRAVHHLTSSDGQLSPLFVEEMMGYSIGWTGLRSSEIQWFRNARRRLSPGSQGSRLE